MSKSNKFCYRLPKKITIFEMFFNDFLTISILKFLFYLVSSVNSLSYFISLQIMMSILWVKLGAKNSPILTYKGLILATFTNCQL